MPRSSQALPVLLLTGLLTLTACQSGGPAATPTASKPSAARPTVVASPAASAPAGTPSPVAASPAPSPAANPAAPAPLGSAAIKDDLVRNDQLLVSMTGLSAPPGGQVYQGWLLAAGQPKQAAGGAMPV